MEFEPGSPLWIAAATLGAGYAAGAVLLRRGDEETRRNRVSPVVCLTLGTAWAVAMTWLSRHFLEGPAWLADIPGAVGRLLQGPDEKLGFWGFTAGFMVIL